MEKIANYYAKNVIEENRGNNFAKYAQQRS